MQIIDISSPYAAEQARVVSDQLSDMGIGDTPRILVMNKLDLVVDSPDQPLTLDVLGQIEISSYIRVVTTSATKNWGIVDLRNAIDAVLSPADKSVESNDQGETASAVR